MGSCPGGELSWGNCPGGKCPSGEESPSVKISTPSIHLYLHIYRIIYRSLCIKYLNFLNHLHTHIPTLSVNMLISINLCQTCFMYQITHNNKDIDILCSFNINFIVFWVFCISTVISFFKAFYNIVGK